MTEKTAPEFGALLAKCETDQLMVLLSDWLEDAADGVNQLLPTRRLRDQLLSTDRSQPVVPGLSIVLGGTPERRDPAAILEAVQCRVERPVLDLQDVLGAAFDRVSNRMPVPRTKNECLEHQHVERALEHLALHRRLTFWHEPQSTPLDYLAVKKRLFTAKRTPPRATLQKSIYLSGCSHLVLELETRALPINRNVLPGATGV